MFPEEDMLKYGPLSDYIYDYVENAEYYWEFFHISFTEMMSMPIPYAKRLREIANERRQNKRAKEEFDEKKFRDAFMNPP